MKKQQPWYDGRSVPIAFWLLGLLNNTPYIIMFAAAKTISQGGTALVFIADIGPSLVLKASAPYWFDRVSYRCRMLVSAILMALSFSTIAVYSSSATPADQQNYGTNANQMRTTMQLWGVAMVSAQCGLGEASLLALGGKFDAARTAKNQCLVRRTIIQPVSTSSGTMTSRMEFDPTLERDRNRRL